MCVCVCVCVCVCMCVCVCVCVWVCGWVGVVCVGGWGASYDEVVLQAFSNS